MKKYIFLFFTTFLFQNLIGQDLVLTPPIKGPGSPTYSHDKVIQYDFAKKQDGYWLFEPASPRPDSANIIVFNHGYGAYNPMIYGKWIKHLVRKGNIVIFPRYQKNNYFPRPRKFPKNVSQAINDAIEKMNKEDFVKPITKQLAFVGHSYGGVISANLAIHYKKHHLPKPVAVMLCSPGHGPFRGAVLKSYEKMDSNIKLIVMTSENDRTVGEKFGFKVFETATNVTQRNLIRQLEDVAVSPLHYAGHSECYALDKTYDNGKRNGTTRRALKKGKLNNTDYYGYWKIFDALLDCSRSGEHCEYAFGNTPEQRSLGVDVNGIPIKELEIILPPKNENNSVSSH